MWQIKGYILCNMMTYNTSNVHPTDSLTLFWKNLMMLTSETNWMHISHRGRFLKIWWFILFYTSTLHCWFSLYLHSQTLWIFKANYLRIIFSFRRYGNFDREEKKIKWSSIDKWQPKWFYFFSFSIQTELCR